MVYLVAVSSLSHTSVEPPSATSEILYPLFCFQFETFWNPSCLVPRPHYSARQKCFGSRGPSLGYVTEVN